jgi:hypothetical protein
MFSLEFSMSSLTLVFCKGSDSIAPTRVHFSDSLISSYFIILGVINLFVGFIWKIVVRPLGACCLAAGAKVVIILR